MTAILLLLLPFPLPLFAQSARIASDFEIAQMQKQATSARGFLAMLQAHLNLGDLRRMRSELPLARKEYATAYDLAIGERKDAQQAGEMAQYVTATMYAGLAKAKLGDGKSAFSLLEEASRHGSHLGSLWNVYSIAMTALGEPKKALTAARNAVTVADAETARERSVKHLTDAAIARFSLAQSLLENDRREEAVVLLETIVASLAAKDFDSVRRNVARTESFEIYSSVQTDEQAYLALANRSRLKLAALYEERGATAKARAMYETVLQARSDDAYALAGVARLTAKSEERERRYIEAFDANPFLLPLVREFQRSIADSKPAPIEDPSTTGAEVRRALVQLARGETRAARETLTALNTKFPGNRTLETLLAETEIAPLVVTLPGAKPAGEELRRLIALFAQERLTPEQRVQLDQMTFTSAVTFNAQGGEPPAGQTIFEAGTVDGVAFRFSEPTAFAGTFRAATPLRLTYRILGATELDGADALLFEPLRLEPAP
jgi:hypothetical protein